MKMGFVHKENYDEDNMSEFERHKRENNVLAEKQEMEAKAKEESAKAYNEWLAQKEMRDSALKCLSLVPKPVAEIPVAHDDERGSANVNLRRSQQGLNLSSTAAGNATLNPMQNPSLSRHCIDVGKAMKKVDRTTFLDWAKWCEGVFSINVAGTLWDFFPPVACDVHCASYSQVLCGSKLLIVDLMSVLLN